MIPEVELILRCARTQLAPEASDRVEELLRQPLDWDLIQKHARDHGLLALLARTLLSDSRFLLPPEARKSMEDFSRQNAERNLAITTELLQILARLEQSGIAAIGYKGPVLAAMVYGNIALREFSDLDLLVTPQAAQVGHDALVKLGYRPEAEFSPKQERIYRRVGSEYNFTTANGLRLRLHWRILPTYYSLDFDVDKACSRLVTVQLARSPVRALSPEDALLALTLQGSQHGWRRLQSVCDVAHLISAFPQMSWPDVWQRARKTGVRRLLRVAITLAAGLFGAPISRSLEAEIRRDRTALQLASALADSLTSLNSVVPEKFDQLLLKGRERWRDRARYLANRATNRLAARFSRQYLKRIA